MPALLDHTVVERDVFRLVNNLPDVLIVLFWPVMQLGTRFAPYVLGTVALLAGRVRMGLSLMVAGTGAWICARVLKDLVERDRPAGFLTDLPREWSRGGPGFVSGHMAVAAAMATVIAPYLPRRWRRVVWVLAWMVGFGRVYTGVHLPLDIVGGFAVGWFVGSAVHAAMGAPRSDPEPSRVQDMLRRFGLDVVDVRPAGVSARSSHPFRAVTGDGRRLFVKVLDPDPRDTDWLFRLARVFALREVRDEDAMVSLPSQAEHEAAVTMAARAAWCPGS